MSWRNVKLAEVITHRKEFITIDNSVEYKRCRVKVNRKGIVLRDLIKGVLINTKKQQVCKEGDFLVAEIDAKVGGYGFVPKQLDEAIVSSHYFLFEVDESKMLKNYLDWIIKTDIIQEQISSKGSTNYAAIRPSHVLNFDIPLLSLDEQKKLVERLNNIDAEHSLLNNELNNQQTHLQQLRKAILQEAVQGKLTKQNTKDEPASKLLQRIKAEKQKLIAAGKLKKEKELPPITEAEIPFELPKGWVWCRLGDLVNQFLGGYAFKSGDLKREGLSQVLRLGNVKNDKLLVTSNPVFIGESVSNEAITNELFERDILITMTGTRLKRDYCFTVVLEKKHFEEQRLFLNQRVGCMRLNSQLDSKFISLALKADNILDYIFNEETGTANQGNIGVGTIKSTPFPLPPLSEQQRIVAKVEQLMQQVQNLEQQVGQSQKQAGQLLQAVLKEAFNPTGGASKKEGKKGKAYKMNDKLTLAAEE